VKKLPPRAILPGKHLKMPRCPRSNDLIATTAGLYEWLADLSSGPVLLASDYFGLVGRDELLINAVSNLGRWPANACLYFRKDVASADSGGFELVAAPVNRRAALARRTPGAVPFSRATDRASSRCPLRSTPAAMSDAGCLASV